MGVLTPMDTLCSQSHGSKHWELYRHTTLRAILFCVLVSLCIILPIWIFSFDILILLRQPTEIAYKASLFCHIYIAVLPCYISKEVLRRFLVCQTISKPLFYIGIICELLFHPTLLYVVFHVLQTKHFIFAPICNLITCYLYLILLLCHMAMSSKIIHETLIFPYRNAWKQILSWRGVRVIPVELYDKDEPLKNALLNADKDGIVIIDNGCKEYFELAIFGTFSYCGEWWQMELITIFAGTLGANQLNAHMIFYQLETLLFMIPLGISISSASRVGHLLADRQLQIAQFVSWFSLIFTFGVDLLVIATLLIIHFEIMNLPAIFTDDQDIISIANHLLFVFMSLFFFDSFQAVCQGLLRGMKRQKQTAIVACISLYCVGLPASIALGFQFGLDLKVFGFWIGQNIGYATFCVSLIIILLVHRPQKGVGSLQYEQSISYTRGSVQCKPPRLSI
eukprot:155010_1